MNRIFSHLYSHARISLSLELSSSAALSEFHPVPEHIEQQLQLLAR